jgi:hypothetical protein
LGIAPALLIFWVRISMREPESWQAARERAALDQTRSLGRLGDLFAASPIRQYTLLGTGLAVIGLATFWGTHFRGKDLLREVNRQEQHARGASQPDADELKRYEMLGMFLVTTGGGLGLLSFAPLSQRLGRRGAFWVFHVGGFLLTAAVVVWSNSATALWLLLPIFGFFTLGMHAGYAVYFPELFPTRLRGTGAGFCFNVARIVAAPVLLGFGWLQDGPLGFDLPARMMLLGSLFLVGALLVYWCPETRGQPLPE